MEQRNQECFLVTEKQDYIQRILSYEDSFIFLNSEKASQFSKGDANIWLISSWIQSKYVVCVCVCVCEREREREGGIYESIKNTKHMLISVSAKQTYQNNSNGKILTSTVQSQG